MGLTLTKESDTESFVLEEEEPATEEGKYGGKYVSQVELTNPRQDRAALGTLSNYKRLISCLSRSFLMLISNNSP